MSPLPYPNCRSINIMKEPISGCSIWDPLLWSPRTPRQYSSSHRINISNENNALGLTLLWPLRYLGHHPNSINYKRLPDSCCPIWERNEGWLWVYSGKKWDIEENKLCFDENRGLLLVKYWGSHWWDIGSVSNIPRFTICKGKEKEE